jgi:peptidase E
MAPAATPRGGHVTLLGPQRLQPTLGPTLRSLGIDTGRVATVTAGWQEREPDDAELHEHLERRSINLSLYLRGERVFLRDPELAAAHAKRQARLRELQDLYNLRLDHLMATAYELERRDGGSELVVDARRGAVAAIRALDAEHLQRVRAIHTEYQEQWRPATRDAVARERNEVDTILRDSTAVAIAGGHVAVLLNRLRLFGLDTALGGRVVVAWSAGAMAISETVVLFHDAPPHGMGNAEVLEVGLGLAPGIVPLPHARHRLRLGATERVALFAQRFAPAACVPMNEGARLDFGAGGWTAPAGTARLLPDGGLGHLELS